MIQTLVGEAGLQTGFGDDTMPAIQSERMRRAMSTTTLGTMIDFYGADMRLKNRTTDSINSNLGHLRRFAEHAGGRDLKLSRITPEIARD